ncbi:MAG TPA: hypothetical protein VFY16_01070 [Gemmatimonadaceae bacterium]|nr:hypothetical protein [Gemmatimonadaceae bacterium]
MAKDRRRESPSRSPRPSPLKRHDEEMQQKHRDERYGVEERQPPYVKDDRRSSEAIEPSSLTESELRSRWPIG